MTPVNKAIWFIESHFDDDINLQTIADMSYVSRHHLVRAFGTATGYSVMRYVRARRLSVAAEKLVTGAPNILDVAIDAGYNSHEAFTRAFCNQFGITPEALRRQQHLENISLVEPIIMTEQTYNNLQPPQIITGKSIRLVGLTERYSNNAPAHIPSQWQRFGQYLDSFDAIPNRTEHVTYGVCTYMHDNGDFDYIASVAVSDFENVPTELATFSLPEQLYAVFTHTDHISTISQSWHTLWNKTLPESGYEFIDAPTFERYDDTFDPVTGTGGIELWVPIKKA